MSNDPDQDYFCDGISEDILTGLSKVRWFLVIARNSSFTYKGRSVHIRQIAAELGVRYVVEGSVRKEASRVRITAQLNDATTGSHLWAEHYDRELVDVFAVQDEITNAIVAAIEPQIYVAENFRARRKPPASMDAWDLSMRALSHYWRITREDHVTAQALLEKAIAIDPNYGQAQALLAASHMFGAHLGWAEHAKAVPIAERAAVAAVQLDREDAWAHTALGSVYFSTRRLDDALSEFETACSSIPTSAGAGLLRAGAVLCRPPRVPSRPLSAPFVSARAIPRLPSITPSPATPVSSRGGMTRLSHWRGRRSATAVTYRRLSRPRRIGQHERRHSDGRNGPCRAATRPAGNHWPGPRASCRGRTRPTGTISWRDAAAPGWREPTREPPSGRRRLMAGGALPPGASRRGTGPGTC